ncbi:MAG TPA: hypothetical protein VL899_06400 [Alphaproteobacteria bacterium]|nr:hypothetical protein [Alphaproteobacteria bacterium]
MRLVLFLLAALSIPVTASAADRLTDTSRFQAAFQGSFYGFDVCGDSTNGKLYRKALMDKVQHCPFTKDAKSDFTAWAAGAEAKGGNEIRRYISEHDKLPPRLDRRKANCIAQQQNDAYKQALAALAKYAGGEAKADAVVPDACEAGQSAAAAKVKP